MRKPFFFWCHHLGSSTCTNLKSLKDLFLCSFPLPGDPRALTQDLLMEESKWAAGLSPLHMACPLRSGPVGHCWPLAEPLHFLNPSSPRHTAAPHRKVEKLGAQTESQLPLNPCGLPLLFQGNLTRAEGFV